VLVPVNAASAACVARPLAGKPVGSSATTTVLTLPGFMRATLICATVRGQRGLRGVRGPRGVVGPTGPTGPTGPRGLPGMTGADGATGAPGLAGSTGQQGIQGASGVQGARGLIGYASIYNTSAQNVAVAGNVHFNSNGPMSDGFVHATGDAAISVVRAGTYKVTFVVTAVQSNQIAVVVNGAPVAGGVFGVGTAQVQNTGQGIFTLAAGDVITIQNHTSATSIDLQTNAGGSATNENASIVIEQLA
jgi:hypothetical protein